MKKICLLLICIFISTSTVYAQKGKKGSKKRSATRVTQTGRVNRGGIERIRINKRSIPQIKIPETRLASPSRFGQVSRHSFSSKGRLADANIAALERQVAELERDKQVLEADSKALEFYNDYGRSVLAVPNKAVEEKLIDNPEEETKKFSMTVVKTVYKGKEEIYGIIATHLLPTISSEADEKNGIMRKFEAELPLPDGTKKRIPAEVVQISPRSMLDISLVKFSPEVEKLLKPLELSDKLPTDNQILYSYGFADGAASATTRTMQKRSFIAIKTDVIKVGGKRQGYCGSPILDAQGKVVGIHTGTANGASYGAHAAFINNLVEAYHNGGKSHYDLELDGYVLTSLNVDEYISAFALADEHFRIIYKEDGIGVGWDTFGKYSESRLLNARNKFPQAKYLILHSRKAFWEQSEKSGEYILAEDRTVITFEEGQIREHIYDLHDHELLYSPEYQQGAVLILDQLDGMPAQYD